jgi:DNA-binding transcriptional ArsR family regulator
MTPAPDIRQAAPDPCDPIGKAFDVAFDQSFALLAFAMNRHLIDHMLRAVRELDVDFESLVLWGLLSHLNVAHLVPPGTAPRSVLNEVGRFTGPAGEFRPMRLRDMEQISRMPRETIRRKLKALEEKGFVERRDDGWVFSRDAVEPRLREFNRETLRRILALNEEVRRLLVAGHAQALRDQGA